MELIVLIITITCLIFSTVNIITNIYQISPIRSLHYRKLKNKDSLTSIIIPVRNEEENIGNLLTDIQNLDPNQFEIIVVDDHSSDNTRSILETFPNVRILQSKKLPSQWLGKQWACLQGYKQSKGEVLVFLDADVRIKSNIIVETSYFLANSQFGFISIFPKQIMTTLSEKVIIPIISISLYSLLPLWLGRYSRNDSIAAAIGQFMAFRRDVYETLGTHEAVKDSVDDVGFARIAKRKGISMKLYQADESLQCRMYPDAEKVFRGLRRSLYWTLYPFRIYSVVPLILFIFSLSLFPIYLSLQFRFGWLLLLFILAQRIAIAIKSQTSVIISLITHIPTMLLWTYSLISLLISTKNIEWRGRKISQQ